MPIEEDFILETEGQFDCSFEINSSTVTWGNIEGDIENQTDLKNALDSKADDTEITEIDGRLDTIEGTISGYGDIVTHDTDEFATAEQGQKADSAVQPSDLNNYVPNTRTVNGKALSSNITLNYSDVEALPDTTTIKDLTTTAQQNALNSGATTTNIGQITTNTNAISLINEKIPSQASTSNQLADKNFVNSSIATNTANFIGTFNSVADLEAYSGTVTNNDYAFVVGVDSDGNTVYNRYKYNGDTEQWLFEYALNNSSFTAQQWASINSGITSSDVTLIGTALQPNDDITKLNNNAGFTSNIGTVISVNNTSPDANGNVSLTIPPAQVQADWDEADTTSKAYIKNKPNIPSSVVIDQVFDGTSENGQSGKAILPVLHSSKGYTESGQVYSDSTLYNDVLAQYHSTFDLSKFTVVGTPTITTDGIVSNFGGLNSITIYPFSLDMSTINSLILKGRAIWKSKDASIGYGVQVFVVLLGGTIQLDIYNGQYRLRNNVLPVNATTDTFNLNEGDIIDFVLEMTKTKTTLSAIVNGVTYSNTNTGDNSTATSTGIRIGQVGANDTSYYSTSAIDLKQFSITVDGVEVFSGNKTGTDLIITDNYTVVGTPTITDGVMSNIHWNTAQGGYATTGTFLQNLGNYDTWSVEIPITFRSSWGNNFDFFLYDGTDSSNFAIMLQINSGRRIRISLKAEDGTNISYGDTSTDTFSGGESVTAKLVFTGAQYILYTKKPNENWKAQITKNNAKKLKVTNRPFLFGISWRYQEDWGGSIDLYGIRFIGNNNLIYACKCQIPYNISDSGNKIVDVQYRPDVYYANYLGYKSSYFTIDTVNQNVTLPYTDVYGLINRSLDYNYTRIQGYDGTATQTLKHVNGVLQWVTDTP